VWSFHSVQDFLDISCQEFIIVLDLTFSLTDVMSWGKDVGEDPCDPLRMGLEKKERPQYIFCSRAVDET
ncbi:hypothetical protein STEG23_004722, partial [Scotinomys teguina]